MTAPSRDLSPDFIHRLVNCASDAARAAGVVALDRFQRVQQVTHKGVGTSGNIVTEVDLLAEEVIVGRIRERFADHSIVSEESPADEKPSDWTWVVDPIDGTLNYAYGLGNWCVSVGVLRAGVPTVGVIYEPIRDELFVAAPELGATLNGAPIRASRKEALDRALIGFDLGYVQETRTQVMAAANLLRPHVQGLRLLGSAALSLAYVAAGRLDGYFHLFLYPWDLAAALSLLREAGAYATTWEGASLTPVDHQIVAAGPRIHDGLRIRLKDALTLRSERP